MEFLRTGNASVSGVARQLRVPVSTLVDRAKKKGIDLTEYTPRKKRGAA